MSRRRPTRRWSLRVSRACTSSAARVGEAAAVSRWYLRGGERLDDSRRRRRRILVRAVVLALRRRVDDLAGGPHLRRDRCDRSATLDRWPRRAGARALRSRSPLGSSVPLSQSAWRSPQDSRVGSRRLLGALQAARARDVCVAGADEDAPAPCAAAICCCCSRASTSRTRGVGAGMSASRDLDLVMRKHEIQARS